MRYLLTLSLFLFANQAFCQKVHDSLLTKFYNKTLATYFSGPGMPHKDQIKFGNVLIRTKFDTTELIKQVSQNKLKFVEESELRNEFIEPIEENSGRDYYWITHKIIAQDTIDVNINGSTITIENKDLFIGVWCGGTLGYIPDSRFIYNSASQTWEFHSGKEILAKKIKSLPYRKK